MKRGPTIKQKKTLTYLSENIGASLGGAMRSAGYSESTSRTPQRLTQSLGWQELLGWLDDGKIMERVYQIALDSSDKRACLQAVEIILKLKDRYPANKLKVQAYEEEINRIKD